MIVTSIETGWQIIHQPAHALLAFDLAQHWKKDRRPVRWLETLTAVAAHDDTQGEWKGRSHLTEAGAPVDYRLHEYKLTDVDPMIDAAWQKSRWHAMLITMHAAFIYKSEHAKTAVAGQDKDLNDLLASLDVRRARWRKLYGTTPKEEQYAYDFVQFCDALSLVLAQSQLPLEERRIEVSKGPDGKPYYGWLRNDSTIGLDPWPFEDDEFAVHLEAYPVHKLSFTDDADLHHTLDTTDAVELSWTFRKD
jgi:hypothetical protein